MSPVESFNDKKNQAKQDLDNLKADIEGIGNEEANLDPATLTGDAANEKRDELHHRTEALRSSASSIVAEWKNYFPDAAVDTALDDVEVKINAKVETILAATAIGGLKTELLKLQDSVDNAPGTDNDIFESIDLAKQKIDLTTVKPVVDDSLTAAEATRANSNLKSGLLEKFGPVHELVVMFVTMKAEMEKLGCWGDEACVSKVESKVEKMKENFDNLHGPKKARAEFAKNLEKYGIQVVQGGRDQAGFRLLKQLEADHNNEGLTREQIILNESEKYAQNFKQPGGDPDHQVTTLYGILGKMETVTLYETNLLEQEEPTELHLVAGQPPIKLLVTDKGLSINGFGFGLVPSEETDKEYYIGQASLVDNGGNYSLSYTVQKKGFGGLFDKVVYQNVDLNSNADIAGFLANIESTEIAVSEKKLFGPAEEKEKNFHLSFDPIP